MRDEEIGPWLESGTDGIDPGSPPLAAIRDGAARRRRTRQRAGGAAALAVVLAAVLVGTLVPLGSSSPPVARDPQPAPDTTESRTADELEVAEGMRLVGVGNVAIEVPAAWRTDEEALKCGTPQEDAAVVKSSVICLALVPQPPDIDGVVLSVETPLTGSRSLVAFDVTAIERQDESCGRVRYGDLGSTTTHGRCTIGLSIGAVQVRVSVTAPTSGEAARRAEALVSEVRFVHDVVGIPPTGGAWSREESSAALAVRQLEILDLRPVIVYEKASARQLRGMPVRTDPPAGTVVPRGTTVTLYVLQ